MANTSRVQRWREGKKKEGLKAVTIWLTKEEELRLKDLALQWHCSPSAVMQHALAQFSAQTAPGISPETDTSQIRELIRVEFLAIQGEKTIVTDTVTGVVTDTLARDLPGLVRQLVEGLAVTATNGNVTDTEGSITDTDSNVTETSARAYVADTGNSLVTDTNGNPPDTSLGEEATTRLAPQRTRGAMRQRILTLLQEHPEGLSAEEMRVYLKAEKPLGDTLQGMRKQQKVRTRGKGKDMRYFVA